MKRPLPPVGDSMVPGKRPCAQHPVRQAAKTPHLIPGASGAARVARGARRFKRASGHGGALESAALECAHPAELTGVFVIEDAGAAEAEGTAARAVVAARMEFWSRSPSPPPPPPPAPAPLACTKPSRACAAETMAKIDRLQPALAESGNDVEGSVECDGEDDALLLAGEQERGTEVDAGTPMVAAVEAAAAAVEAEDVAAAAEWRRWRPRRR